MKNKKGFTLIELLAIIVILAIIAVITVPIILNIIENAKKGAATNSAYGYKDAIDKFYATKLTRNPDYDIPDGLHTKVDFDTMGVAYSGKSPLDNSFLKTYKNRVIQGCLQFDEYKVEIVDGKVTQASKGTCKTIDVMYVDVNENGKIDLGDTVRIENDDFYVLEEPSYGQVKILPKYNLNSESRQDSNNPVIVLFSGGSYWWSHKTDYPYDDYYYVYTRNTENNLYTYFENYKSYLIELGATFVTDTWAMSYEDAHKYGCTGTSGSCPTYISNQNYWLGSAGPSENQMWHINADGRMGTRTGTNSFPSGIRPVISINESAITNQYKIKFDTRNGSEVASKIIITGEKIGPLETPTKPAATFIGWYEDKEYTTPVTQETIPIGSVTYYAKWSLTKVEYVDEDGSETITLGDTARICDDEFYILEGQKDGKVKMIPKYNLNVSSRQDPKHTLSILFSSGSYWWSHKTDYPKDSQQKYYVYENVPQNKIYSYIENYKNHLINQGSTFVLDAKPMSYGEAHDAGCTGSSSSCPAYISNQNYWLGSAGTSENQIWHISTDGRMGSRTATNSSPSGVRPMIIIKESAIANEYTIKFDSRGGSQVNDKIIPEGAQLGTLPSNPTKTGATFIGWYEDTEYTIPVTAETIPIGSVTYYAKWSLTKVEYVDEDGNGTVNLGDTTKINSDEFYIIASPSEGKVKMLPKYNLTPASRQGNIDTLSILFSSGSYWWSHRADYPKDAQDKYYVYENVQQNRIYSYIDNYKNYLINQGATFILDAKPMSYAEAYDAGCTGSSGSCPAYISNQNYWLGSAGTSENQMWHINTDGRMGSRTATNSFPSGVRPLIIINESALTN